MSCQDLCSLIYCDISQKSISSCVSSSSSITCSQPDSILHLIDLQEPIQKTPKQKPRSHKWGKRDTEMFYKGLSLYGLDFLMIQKLIPSRNKKQIANKYKKQNKVHSQRIDQVLRASWEEQGWLKQFSGQ